MTWGWYSQRYQQSFNTTGTGGNSIALKLVAGHWSCSSSPGFIDAAECHHDRRSEIFNRWRIILCTNLGPHLAKTEECDYGVKAVPANAADQTASAFLPPLNINAITANRCYSCCGNHRFIYRRAANGYQPAYQLAGRVLNGGALPGQIYLCCYYCFAYTYGCNFGYER